MIWKSSTSCRLALAAGVYLYRLSTPLGRVSRLLTVVK